MSQTEMGFQDEETETKPETDAITVVVDRTLNTKSDVTITCGAQTVAVDIPDETIYALPVDQKRLVGDVAAIIAAALSQLEVRSVFVPPAPETADAPVEETAPERQLEA